MVKWTLQNAPALLMSVFIGLTILGAMASALWTGILGQFATISGLGNFSFTTLVGNASTSLTVILLSITVISAIFAVFGYTIYKQGR